MSIRVQGSVRTLSASFSAVFEHVVDLRIEQAAEKNYDK